MSTPKIKGKNFKFSFQLADSTGISKTLVIQGVDFEIGPNVTEIADPILGRDRDDLDVEINFYDLSFNCLTSNLIELRAFLDHQKGKDEKVAMAESAVGILIEPYDGTSQSYQVRKFVLGGWKLNVGGRVERVKISVPGRAEYFDPLPTAA